MEEVPIKMYLSGVSPYWKIGVIAIYKVYSTSMFMCMESIYILTGAEYLESAVLVDIVVDNNKYNEVLGSAKSMKKDRTSWVSFFLWLWDCGLDGVKLIVFYTYLGIEKSVNEDTSICWLTSFTPESVYQFVEHS